MTMTQWTSDEINKIAAVDELQIAAVRNDGTLRKPVTIWIVRVGDDLYVRSANGRTAAWFRGALLRHEGHIRAGGVEKDVSFEEITDSGLNDQIDAAYLAKYQRYQPYVKPMVTPKVRAATIKLVPRLVTV
jgi:hypothetical protein